MVNITEEVKSNFLEYEEGFEDKTDKQLFIALNEASSALPADMPSYSYKANYKANITARALFKYAAHYLIAKGLSDYGEAIAPVSSKSIADESVSYNAAPTSSNWIESTIQGQQYLELVKPFSFIVVGFV